MGKKLQRKKRREPDPRSIRERAYDWLYDHHVTVKVMDYVIAGLAVFGIAVVICGMIFSRI